MTCYSFLGHKYNIFKAILSRLITLKTLKNQKVFGAFPTESLVGLCFKPKAAFSHIKLLQNGN